MGFKSQRDKQKIEEEHYLNKIMDFIASEAKVNLYFNKYQSLENLDKNLSLDKSQPKKEEPDYATKKIHLPTTHRSPRDWTADIWIINRGTLKVGETNTKYHRTGTANCKLEWERVHDERKK